MDVPESRGDAPGDESWTDFGTWRVVSVADTGGAKEGDEITLGLGPKGLIVVGPSGAALDTIPYDELEVREISDGTAELRDGLGPYATLRPVGRQRTVGLISQLDLIRSGKAPDRPVSIWTPT